MSVHQGWIASLSDGSQRFESKQVPGEKSSWQKLLDELDNTGLKLTGLYLQRGSSRFYAMPHKMCDGYMQAYEVQKDFWQGTGEMHEIQKHYQGVGSIIGEHVYLTWVNLQTGDVHQDRRTLLSCNVHTTLREANDDRPSNERGSG